MNCEYVNIASQVIIIRGVSLSKQELNLVNFPLHHLHEELQIEEYSNCPTKWHLSKWQDQRTFVHLARLGLTQACPICHYIK